MLGHRLQRENYWMNALGANYPYRLNEKNKFKE